MRVAAKRHAVSTVEPRRGCVDEHRHGVLLTLQSGAVTQLTHVRGDLRILRVLNQRLLNLVLDDELLVGERRLEPLVEPDLRNTTGLLVLIPRVRSDGPEGHEVLMVRLRRQDVEQLWDDGRALCIPDTEPLTN